MFADFNNVQAIHSFTSLWLNENWSTNRCRCAYEALVVWRVFHSLAYIADNVVLFHWCTLAHTSVFFVVSQKLYLWWKFVYFSHHLYYWRAMENLLESFNIYPRFFIRMITNYLGIDKIFVEKLRLFCTHVHGFCFKFSNECVQHLLYSFYVSL